MCLFFYFKTVLALAQRQLTRHEFLTIISILKIVESLYKNLPEYKTLLFVSIMPSCMQLLSSPPPLPSLLSSPLLSSPLPSPPSPPLPSPPSPPLPSPPLLFSPPPLLSSPLPSSFILTECYWRRRAVRQVWSPSWEMRKTCNIIKHHKIMSL